MKRVLAFALLPLAACATLHQGPTHLSGEWGGPHAGLVLEGASGTVQYDCASGTIDDAIPAADGAFSVSGTYREGQPGPVRVGQIFRSQPAEYRGTVAGDTIELTAVLEDGTVIGPYRLTRGAQPQLTRCL